MDYLKILRNKSETQKCSIMSIYNTIKLVYIFHFRSLEYSVLNEEFKFKRLCENEMRWCLYTVHQLSMLISIYENEILKGSV